MQIDPKDAQELAGLIEDTIEYFCDENLISGEVAWAIAECLAVAKQNELQGLLSV